MEKTSSLKKLKTKYIFSIEGNISSGKTTIITILKKSSTQLNDFIFVEKPLKNWQNVAGENLLDKKNKDIERWGFSFESYVLITIINELIKVADSKEKIIFIERSILTDKSFFDAIAEKKLCTPMEEVMFRNIFYFFKDNAFPEIKGIIYLDTPPEECFSRIKERNREEEQSISMDYLKKLETKFKAVIKNAGVPILYLNGNYDLKKDVSSIEKKLKDFIIKNINEK